MPEPIFANTKEPASVRRAATSTEDERQKFISDCAASPSVVLALLDEVESLRKDAERYRWLRDQRWYSSKLFVVSGGRETVRLGTDCPSLDRLDTAIDAAMQAKEEG